MIDAVFQLLGLAAVCTDDAHTELGGLFCRHMCAQAMLRDVMLEPGRRQDRGYLHLGRHHRDGGRAGAWGLSGAQETYRVLRAHL